MSENDDRLITVNAYSGYKANERPMDFTMGGMKVRISEIMEHWIEPDRDCFKVKGDNGKKYFLFRFQKEDLWQIKEVY
jgi:hypothetical protein